MCYGTAYMILDTTGTAYAFYEREKTKEKKQKLKGPPRRRCGILLKRTS